MNSHAVSPSFSSSPIAAAVHHRLWMPDASQPPLVEWWRPLIEYARRLRADDFPWALFVEDFDFIGSVARDRLPTVSLYQHQAGGGELCVGPDGLPFRFVWASRGASIGRFAECELRRAIWSTGLPDLLTPAPRRHPYLDDDEPLFVEPDAEPEPLAPVRHLRRV
jgi:hypothetical protein